MEISIIAAWFTGVVGGAMGGLALTQVITGRQTYPIRHAGIPWTPKELKTMGVIWSVYWTALTIYGLSAALSFSEGRYVPLGGLYGFPVGGIVLFVVLIACLLTQAMIEQRRRGEWPFKRKLGGA